MSNLLPLFVVVAVLLVAFIAATLRASRPLPCPSCGKRALDAIETARADGVVTQLHECRACKARFRKRGDEPFEKL